MLGLVTKVNPNREDKLARPEEVNPRAAAARAVPTPEFVEQENVEAVIARVEGQNIDGGRERWQNLVRGHTAKAKVVPAWLGWVHLCGPLGVDLHEPCSVFEKALNMTIA